MTEEECRVAFENYILDINQKFFNSRGTGLSEIEIDGYYDLFLNKLNGGASEFSIHYLYKEGDLAFENNILYKCISQVKGEKPSTLINFSLLGASGSSGSDRLIFFDKAYLEYDGTNYSGQGTTEMDFLAGVGLDITFKNFIDGVDTVNDLFFVYSVHEYTNTGIVTKTWPRYFEIKAFNKIYLDNVIINTGGTTGDNKMVHSIVVYKKI